MDDELTRRLIEVRTHLDVIESVGGLYLDFSEMAEHVSELIRMRSELGGIYQAEQQRLGERTSLTAAEQVELNAVAETLETAHVTAVWLAAELRAVSPEHADRPDIVEFERMMREMQSGMTALGQRLSE